MGFFFKTLQPSHSRAVPRICPAPLQYLRKRISQQGEHEVPQADALSSGPSKEDGRDCHRMRRSLNINQQSINFVD